MAENGSPAAAVAFFDIDGTLMGEPSAEFKRRRDAGEDVSELFFARRPTDAIYDAFQRMDERGNMTFICSGRPLYMVSDPLRALNPTGIIAEAGAYVSVGDEVLRDVHVPLDIVFELGDFFFDERIPVEWEGNIQNTGIRPTVDGPLPFPGSLVATSREQFREMAERLNFAKFCIRNPEPGVLDRVRPMVEENFTIADMRFDIYEFSLKGVDKGSAIELVLDHLGRDRRGSYAFGDSENDLSMAPAVETFVAMGNALPHVAAKADWVTRDVAEDGVAWGLEHFGLI